MDRRRVRIICTIGPSSSNPDTIRELIKNGLNIARLNFSHGTHEGHREVIHMVRSIAAEMGVYVGILQDLQGPKIRLGILPEEGVTLTAGQEIALQSGLSYTEGVLPVSYEGIEKDVFPGESILLADGLIELDVLRVEGEKVVCTVINGGQIFSRKGVNMPFSNLSIPSFSEKDREDLAMGLEEKVDFVALSFVRSESDLVEVRRMLDKADYGPKLIAKIEKPQAVSNIKKILEKVDAVMVARGDLGVEVPLEKVPVIQKEIIKAAREVGKEVIIATQMLMSMVLSPRPTRGEVSDVANAVLDEADALMLSDESASGSYPVEACAMLSKIASATEPTMTSTLTRSSMVAGRAFSVSFAVGRAAGWLASDVGAAAIIAYTQSGFTAHAVARFRPECPILALTPNEHTCRQLTICWGTTPVLIKLKQIDNTGTMLEEAKMLAVNAGFAKKGDRIVLTAGMPTGETGSTNLLRVMEI